MEIIFNFQLLQQELLKTNLQQQEPTIYREKVINKRSKGDDNTEYATQNEQSCSRNKLELFMRFE